MHHPSTVLPVLYNFRRCPYAMRARMALAYTGQRVEMREILLKDKPEAMLQASPKGTVPVLVLPNSSVLDESLEIMRWALAQRPGNDWQFAAGSDPYRKTNELIHCNDHSFKIHLDQYKYGDQSHKNHHKQAAEKFLAELNRVLAGSKYLFADHITLADIAIFPFIRQFSRVDENFFAGLPYERLQQWLDTLIDTDLFRLTMHKVPLWHSGDTPIYFP